MARWIGLISTIVLLALATGLIRWWSGATIRDLAIEFAFVFLILSIGILRIFFPRVRNLFDKGFSYYCKVTIILVCSFIPVSVFFSIAKFVVGSSEQLVQVAFFVMSVVVWLASLSFLVKEEWQKWLFHNLSIFGWLSPLVFIFNYVMISVILFGSCSFLVYEVWHIAKLPNANISLDTFLNLYFWHVLDAIPMLKINETIPWNNPIHLDEASLLGWLSILFKLAVIVPGIGAFTTYWKSSRGVTSDGIEKA